MLMLHSGSIFYKMKIPPNVYIVTACGVTEVTYSCKYDKGLKNYPCDLFSHAWITDMEQNNKHGHTFNQEFEFIQQNIIFCNACQYGDKNKYGPSTINSFFLLPDSNVSSLANSAVFDKNGPVLQTDVPLSLAQHLYEDDPTEENRKNLQKELTIRKVVDTMNSRIIEAAKPGISLDVLGSCTQCDYNSCPCYKDCLKHQTKSFCQSLCYKIDKCVSEFLPAEAEAVFDKCLDILDEEYINACGIEHPYLRKADVLLYNLCRRGGVNVQAAVNEIRKQCSMFKNANFFSKK